MENTVLFSTILADAKHNDFLGEPLLVGSKEEKLTNISPKETIIIRTHNTPSYGYYEPDFEDTRDWYDCFWSLFCTIKDGLVVSTWGNGNKYDGCKIIFDTKETSISN